MFILSSSFKSMFQEARDDCFPSCIQLNPQLLEQWLTQQVLKNTSSVNEASHAYLLVTVLLDSGLWREKSRLQHHRAELE